MGLEGVYMDKVSVREYQPRLANIYIYTYTRVARKIVCVVQVLTPYAPFRCSRHVCWLILWSDFVLSARIIIHKPIGGNISNGYAWFMDMQYCSQSRYRDISMPGRISRSVNIVGEYRNLSVLTSRQFCLFFFLFVGKIISRKMSKTFKVKTLWECSCKLIFKIC